MTDFNGHPKIEHGIPIPPSTRGKRATAVWASMNIGDSVLFPATDQGDAWNRAHSWASYHGKGWKFVTRKQPDGSTRVWRVK